MTNNLKDNGYKEVVACRMCGSGNLGVFIDLGFQPLANSFLTQEKLNEPEPVYPLKALVCKECWLVQLSVVVDSEIMFRDYVYFSSGMPASKHFRDYAESIVKRFTVSPSDLVVEIGSNDGHFLAVVKEAGVRILGVDPAKNIAAQANERGIPTIPEFFSESIAEKIVAEHGHPAAVVGNNVVAHIDNHQDLARGIKKLLGPESVFVFEAPYLVDMFENLSFDTIYHEHLSYLAVSPLQHLFAEHGLDIFAVEVHPIQGNSIRVFVCPKGARPIEASVAACLAQEKELGLDRLESYEQLAQKIEELKGDVMNVLARLKTEGKRLVGYGAPAKGNTLLNYYDIGTEILEYATEELPSKIGLFTPGKHIPVVHVSELKKNPPDYILLLAWNYKKVIVEREAAWHAGGGKFIMPIGSERII